MCINWQYHILQIQKFISVNFTVIAKTYEIGLKNVTSAIEFLGLTKISIREILKISIFECLIKLLYNFCLSFRLYKMNLSFCVCTGHSESTRTELFEVLSMSLLPVKLATDSDMNILLRILMYSALENRN